MEESPDINEEKRAQNAPISNGHSTNEGQKLPQYLVTLSVSLLTTAGGAAIVWPSLALNFLLTTKSITSDQAAWIVHLLPVGAFCGALLAGVCASMVTRKIAILALAVPYLMSWVLIFLAGRTKMIYLARYIAGISAGASYVVVPMYIAEISENSIRGRLGCALHLAICLGILYATFFGSIFTHSYLPIFCSVLPLLFAVAFVKAPESQLYLLQKNKRKQAENVLTILRGAGYNIQKELLAMEYGLFQYSSLTRKTIRNKSLVITFGLMLFQSLSGLGLVMNFSGLIFKEVGIPISLAEIITYLSIAEIVGIAFSAFYIDKVGRKILLQISTAAMAFCTGILGFYFLLNETGTVFYSAQVIAAVVYIAMYSIGIGPIPLIMASEVLPAEIKGLGMGTSLAMNIMISFIVRKFFVVLGSATTFWFISSACSMGLIFVTFFVIETKGKSLAQIQRELSGKSWPSSEIIS